MSKAKDGKLVMGPIWDFDYAAGGPMMWDGGMGLSNLYLEWFSVTNWFAYILKVDWFKQATLRRWNEIRSVLTKSITILAEYKSYIAEASVRNAVIWDFNTDDSVLNFSEYYDWVINYFIHRVNVITDLLTQ